MSHKYGFIELEAIEGIIKKLPKEHRLEGLIAVLNADASKIKQVMSNLQSDPEFDIDKTSSPGWLDKLISGLSSITETNSVVMTSGNTSSINVNGMKIRFENGKLFVNGKEYKEV